MTTARWSAARVRLLLTLHCLLLMSSADLRAQDRAVSLFLQATGFEQPLGMVAPDDGSGWLLVVERRGTVRGIIERSANPVPFLDIRDRVTAAGNEQGLLGVALDPLFDFNEFLYVHYTRAGDGAVVISRFRVAGTNAGRVDPDSERVLLVVPQPTPFHNGGQLAFGPDGYLYVALGDGGGNGRMRAQELDNWHGKILRLDVHPADARRPYSIPPDNPFVGTPGARAEVWAYGLRNPWRFSFDRQNGDLWIADVGEGTWEEINRQPASSPGGENYGWPIVEGITCFEGLTACELSPGWTWPVSFYINNFGDNGTCSVTGGFVYRGRGLAVLRGAYVFGDFCGGRIWAGRPGSSRLLETSLIAGNIPLGLISSFGEDADGELYMTEFDGGRLWKLVPTPMATAAGEAIATPDSDGRAESRRRALGSPASRTRRVPRP